MKRRNLLNKVNMKTKKVRKNVVKSLDNISSELKSLLNDISKNRLLLSEISDSDMLSIADLKRRLKKMKKRMG